MMINALKLSGAACLLTLSTFGTATAQKAPGNYPACDVDSPPANCADNMYVEIVTALAPATGWEVDTSQPGCGPGITKNYIQEALNSIKSTNSQDKFRLLSGNLFSVLQAPVAEIALRNTSGDVHAFIKKNGPKRSDANCVPVSAFIPPESTLVGVRLFAHDIDAAPPQHWGGCLPGQDCSISWCKFMSRPQQITSDGGKAIITTFANWSDNRRRVGHMYVFYRLPDGESPVPII